MKFRDHGYGTWKFDGDGIKTRLDRVLAGLERVLIDGLQYDGVALIGTSGCWLGPLLVMAGHKVVMIRKEGEQSHGSICEGPNEIEFKRLVLVDDLICSGETIAHARRQLGNWYDIHKQYNSETVEPKIVAIVLHDQSHYTPHHKGIPLYGYI